MNAKQKAIRRLGMLVLILMALFPPWQLAYRQENATKDTSGSAGYHPVWFRETPQAEEEDNRENLRHRIDLVRLGIQLVGVLLLINVGVYWLKDR